jgi:hypothetical protein
MFYSITEAVKREEELQSCTLIDHFIDVRVRARTVQVNFPDFESPCSGAAKY